MRLWLFLLVGLVICSSLTLATPTISFFEEFPNETSLGKIKQINFDTNIYVAARNLSDFYKWEVRFKSTNGHIKEVIYWPILLKEEGYWISPWSDSIALKRVFEEIKNREDKRKINVLLDLEPPLKRSKLLYFGNFIQNKKYISSFINESKKNNIIINTVEKSYIPEFLLNWFGLSFGSGHKKIKMYYSSYRRMFLPDFVVDKLFERKAKLYGKQSVCLGVGLISPGIHNEQHKITPNTLNREIELASKYNIKEVIIFQLSGFNTDYGKVIET